MKAESGGERNALGWLLCRRSSDGGVRLTDTELFAFPPSPPRPGTAHVGAPERGRWAHYPASADASNIACLSYEEKCVNPSVRANTRQVCVCVWGGREGRCHLGQRGPDVSRQMAKETLTRPLKQNPPEGRKLSPVSTVTFSLP